MLRLFKYLMKYRKQVIVVLLSMILSLAISTINPLLIENAIENHIKVFDWKGLLIIAGISLTLSIISMFNSKFWMKTMAKVSNNVLMEIRDELYSHIQTLGFSFFDSRPTGKILARVIGDVNSLKDVLQSTVTQLLPDFLLVIVVFVVMLIKNP